jgi:hypothetical protein
MVTTVSRNEVVAACYTLLVQTYNCDQGQQRKRQEAIVVVFQDGLLCGGRAEVLPYPPDSDAATSQHEY